MTPPPMMTIWARSGSGAVGMGSYRSSVGCLCVGQQAGKVWSTEFGHSGLVALHRPFPEVEIQRAGAILDASPQRPAVLADDSLETCPRCLVSQPAPVVQRDQFVELIGGQPALGPEVAQLETRIVVAGVLVVDQPDLLAG